MQALTFDQPYPAAGRIVARIGEIDAGVIYPDEKGCRWRLLLDRDGHEKRAKSVLSAKTAINDALREWLRRAGIQGAAA